MGEWKLFYRRLLPYLKEYRRLAAISIFCALLFVWIDISLALYMRNLIDYAMESQYRSLIIYIIITVVTVIVGFLTNILSINSSGKFAAYITQVIRNEIVGKIPDLPVTYLEKQKTGEMISRIMQAGETLHYFLKDRLPTYVHQFTRAIVCCFILAFISWRLLLVSLIIFPFAFLISKRLSNSIGKHIVSAQHNAAVSDSVLAESIHGSEIVKAFNIFGFLEGKYKRYLEASIAGNIRALRIESAIIPVSIALGLVPLMFCAVYGGYLAYNDQISVGELMAFIQMQNYLNEALNMLPGLMGEIRKLRDTSNYLFELLEESVEPEFGTDTTVALTPAIHFDEVSFSYGGIPVLQDVSFYVQPGELVAVVGPSGSGKSTLLKLLCGFYTPQAGRIMISEVELGELGGRALRKGVALVSQDSFLFPGTIGENICCFQEADSQRLTQSSEVAGLDIPLDSLAGEGGQLLSGGQRQRVAIARALYKDAPILLLDEATSALDAASEANFIEKQGAWNRNNRCTIAVTHRLASAKDANLILVMEKGRIVQRGTHAELMNSGGLYYQLYIHQSQKGGEYEADLFSNEEVAH